MEKARGFQTDIHFCFIDCADHNKLWKILKRNGNTKPLIYHPRNLYVGVRTLDGTTDWFKTGRGVRQDYILSACLFNLHAEYIMRNTRLDESQTEIKIAERNINNLRYADDTHIDVKIGL